MFQIVKLLGHRAGLAGHLPIKKRRLQINQSLENETFMAVSN
jgi:hypothetical protein